MASDQQNPFELAGMMQMMLPNPYTQYKGQLPMPGYMGTPTDAQGNPIQSFTDAQKAHDAWQPPAATSGTTLNSTPQSADLSAYQQGSPYISSGGVLPSGENYGSSSPTYVQGRYNPPPLQQAAAPAAPAPTNPIDMRQAYLTALSNPGKVTTPGANAPEAPPLGQPSVLNSFLAAHPGGGTAAPAGGGYGNKGFFDTLNQLRSA